MRKIIDRISKWYKKSRLKIMNSKPKKTLLENDYFSKEEMQSNWEKLFKEYQKRAIRKTKDK